MNALAVRITMSNKVQWYQSFASVFLCCNPLIHLVSCMPLSLRHAVQWFRGTWQRVAMCIFQLQHDELCVFAHGFQTIFHGISLCSPTDRCDSLLVHHTYSLRVLILRLVVEHRPHTGLPLNRWGLRVCRAFKQVDIFQQKGYLLGTDVQCFVHLLGIWLLQTAHQKTLLFRVRQTNVFQEAVYESFRLSYIGEI